MSASVIEAMLLRWGESPTGRTVTFLLPEDEGPHPFKGLKTGPANGQRLALSIALISDDESTTEHAPQAPQKAAQPVGDIETIYGKPPGRAQRAGMLCQDKLFIDFLYERFPERTEECEGDVAQIVRSICDVYSRSEFDTDEAAGKRWDFLESAFLAENFVD